MTAVDRREADAIADGSIESLLGDPFGDGELGFSAIVRDDDARVLSAAGERVLEQWGASAEFVPASLGGRWVSTPRLVEVFRSVFRRDPSLGLGFGLTTLMAAVNIWVAGDERQRRDAAARLLRGERIAVAFHEISHGNDLLGNECSAQPTDAGWSVSGRKQVINNVDRAESVLVFARTASQAGPRSHSLLWWQKDDATRDRVDTSTRVLTAGVRGCVIGEATFDALPIADEHVVGGVGTGVETALKAFQVTRAVIPAIAVGAVDSTLHLAARYAAERELYRGTVLDLPHARSLIADACADMLVADALSSTVVRALHRSAGECFMLTAASKYLAPQLLNDAMQSMSVLFGSTFYARVEPYAIVEKFVRDLTIVPIGHAGSTSCLLTIIPNLPTWARRADRDVEFDAELFDLASPLDEPDFSRLGMGAGANDPLLAVLRDVDVVRQLEAEDPELAARTTRLHDAGRALQAEVRDCAPTAFAADAPTATFDLARRYTLLAAAGAVVGVWAAARRSGQDGIAADARFVDAALRRIEWRLSGRRTTLPEHLVESLVDHVVECAHSRRSTTLDSVAVFAS